MAPEAAPPRGVPTMSPSSKGHDAASADKTATSSTSTLPRILRFLSSRTSDSLHFHAANGSREDVLRLLESGVQVDFPGPQGKTALMLACINRHAECACLLLTYGANVLLCTADRSRTCLHYAAKGGDTACLQAVLRAAKETPMETHWGFTSYVNWRDKGGVTALHYAARSMRRENVRSLLKEGAHGSLNDTQFRHCPVGSFPLHWAAAAGDVAVVKELLVWGADRAVRDTNHLTPCDLAYRCGNLECAAVLNPRGEEPLCWPSPWEAILPPAGSPTRLLLERALKHAPAPKPLHKPPPQPSAAASRERARRREQQAQLAQRAAAGQGTVAARQPGHARGAQGSQQAAQQGGRRAGGGVVPPQHPLVLAEQGLVAADAARTRAPLAAGSSSSSSSSSTATTSTSSSSSGACDMTHGGSWVHRDRATEAVVATLEGREPGEAEAVGTSLSSEHREAVGAERMVEGAGAATASMAAGEVLPNNGGASQGSTEAGAGTADTEPGVPGSSGAAAAAAAAASQVWGPWPLSLVQSVQQALCLGCAREDPPGEGCPLAPAAPPAPAAAAAAHVHQVAPEDEDEDFRRVSTDTDKDNVPTCFICSARSQELVRVLPCEHELCGTCFLSLCCHCKPHRLHPHPSAPACPFCRARIASVTSQRETPLEP